MTDHGSFQFTIPTNYTYMESVYHAKDIPSPISLALSYFLRTTVKPSDRAGAKCIFERIYSLAVMERRNSGEEK